jgi:hypothetical protein
VYKKKISLLNKIYKKKYQNTYLNTDEVKSYFKIRKEIYSKFLKKQIQHSRTQERLDNTSEYFFNLLNKKINRNNEKKIFLYYKKYSVHLKLKEKYNKKLIKKSNKEMKLNGYIYFANLINKINKINKIQKLNFLLKINDYISINYKKIKSDFDKKIYMKNIKVEKKIIMSFLK